LNDLEWRWTLGLVRRDSFDLRRVKDGVDAVDKSGSALLIVAVSRPISGFRSRFFLARPPDIPKLNLGSFLSAPYLPSLVRRLFVRHPARISVSALKTCCNQMYGVAATVPSLGRRIERHADGGLTGIPRFLPGRHAFLQHVHDSV